MYFFLRYFINILLYCPCGLLEQQLIDANLYGLLGERTAADDEKLVKKKKEKPVKIEVR